MELRRMKCVACRKGEPAAADDEISEYLGQLPDWRVAKQRITRTFRFSGFADALMFTTQVGSLAESEGHHPEIVTSWGRVVVSWWTHAIGALHRNDFIMAAKTDDVYRGFATGRDVEEGPD